MSSIQPPREIGTEITVYKKNERFVSNTEDNQTVSLNRYHFYNKRKRVTNLKKLKSLICAHEERRTLLAFQKIAAYINHAAIKIDTSCQHGTEYQLGLSSGKNYSCCHSDLFPEPKDNSFELLQEKINRYLLGKMDFEMLNYSFQNVPYLDSLFNELRGENIRDACITISKTLEEIGENLNLLKTSDEYEEWSDDDSEEVQTILSAFDPLVISISAFYDDIRSEKILNYFPLNNLAIYAGIDKFINDANEVLGDPPFKEVIEILNENSSHPGKKIQFILERIATLREPLDKLNNSLGDLKPKIGIERKTSLIVPLTSHLGIQGNSTIEFPSYINYFDQIIEGKMRKPYYELLNEAAQEKVFSLEKVSFLWKKYLRLRENTFRCTKIVLDNFSELERTLSEKCQLYKIDIQNGKNIISYFFYFYDCLNKLFEEYNKTANEFNHPKCINWKCFFPSNFNKIKDIIDYIQKQSPFFQINHNILNKIQQKISIVKIPVFDDQNALKERKETNHPKEFLAYVKKELKEYLIILTKEQVELGASNEDPLDSSVSGSPNEGPSNPNNSEEDSMLMAFQLTPELETLDNINNDTSIGKISETLEELDSIADKVIVERIDQLKTIAEDCGFSLNNMSEKENFDTIYNQLNENALGKCILREDSDKNFKSHSSSNLESIKKKITEFNDNPFPEKPFEYLKLMKAYKNEIAGLPDITDESLGQIFKYLFYSYDEETQTFHPDFEDNLREMTRGDRYRFKVKKLESTSDFESTRKHNKIKAQSSSSSQSLSKVPATSSSSTD